MNVDPNHQHNSSSSFMMLNSPSPRMVIASPKLISPSPRMRSPKLVISPSAELTKMNHHNPSSKSSPKHSGPKMSYTNHRHHDAMGSGLHVSSNIADKMVSHPTNSSDDMVQAVDMSGEGEERADKSNIIPVNSPITLTNPSTPSPPPNHPQLAREYSLGPLQETLDSNERNHESGPVDYMLPSSANITLQALERLMDDDDEISGSNHG